MNRKQGCKHEVSKGAQGAAVYGDGLYVIMATFTGSYGETLHRVVGSSYHDIDDCIRKALKYHQQGRQDVCIESLSSGKRMTIHTILAMDFDIKQGRAA